MTPDQKGAFCKVCNKSVHDFTKKEPEEIKTILVEELSAGKKVCGRFNEDQITPLPEQVPSTDTWSLNFQRMKKFAVALFLVFGGYLFSGIKASAQKMGKVAYNYREPVRGEIAITEPTEKDTAKKIICEKPKGDVKIDPIEKLSVLGGVKATPVETPKITGDTVIMPLKGQVTVIETPPPPVVTGSVAITEDIDEPLTIIEPIPLEPIDSAEETVIEQNFVMGMMVAEPMVVEPPVLIDPVPSDSLQNIIDGEFAVEESTYVETVEPAEIKTGTDISAENSELKLESYPNPTSEGMITLKYNLKKDGFASITIYDVNGNLIKSLLPLQSVYASSYETKYDVSDLQAGIYFCELISGHNKTTTRIVISR
jgi:hypothetical protein